MDEQSEPGGDVFAERRAKLAAWRDAGDAYPTQYQPRDEIGPLHEAYAALEAGQDSADLHRVAGRVVARREHGKLTFVVLKDFSGELQLFCQLDKLGDERYAPGAASSACASPSGSCSASRCDPCPRSTTA
jgi:lysyl-tRNA synthetase class 2